MAEVLLFAFTPSLMSHDLLEKIFVAREDLAQELLQSVRDNVASKHLKHSLITGPRGMGKTHLLSILYYRIKEEKPLSEQVRLCWLSEEERGIASYFHLLYRMLETLSKEYNDKDLATQTESLKKVPQAERKDNAERILLDWLGKHHLVLIAENFDDILKRLGESEQMTFRAFLQNHRNCTLLVSTPTLNADLSRYDAPFYGFFHLHNLTEFNVDMALELMKKIATQREDTELLNYLEQPVAKQRLRVVEALAGGHPRIWLLFAGYLTKDSLDELVPSFMKMIDELTPYYQSKMEQLSSQEALVIDYLRRAGNAISVKTLAEDCFLEPNVVSANLNDLGKKGFVTSDKLGRESYYELREPLMRLVFEVKESKNEPIRLIVDFLKSWFTYYEIKKRYDELPEDAIYSSEYLSIIKEEQSEKIQLRKNQKEQKELNDTLNRRIQEIRPRFLTYIQRYYNYIDPGDAEDITQKVIINVLEIIQEKPNLSFNYNHFSALCFQVVRWRVRDHYRKNAESRSISLDDIDVDSIKGSETELSDQIYIKSILENLSNEDSRILNLNISGFTALEIATLTGNEQNRIHKTIHRIRHKVLAMIEHDDIEIYKIDNNILEIPSKRLVGTIPLILSDDVSQKSAEDWLDVSMKAGDGDVKMTIPLRILSAAVDWKATRSRKALFQLRVEERRILESLLPEGWEDEEKGAKKK
jgi:RNA polymerase sigma factor (sigma-70 family)